MKIKNPLMQNRKGDIPTLVLVIGVFAVCGLVIFSFYWSSGSFRQGFDILESMSNLTLISDQVRLYENLGKNPVEISGVENIGNIYQISTEKVEDGKRMFYAEYRIPVKSSP